MFDFQPAAEKRSELGVMGRPRERLSVGFSVLVIAGSSILCWAIVIYLVQAVRAVL